MHRNVMRLLNLSNSLEAALILLLQLQLLAGADAAVAQGTWTV